MTEAEQFLKERRLDPHDEMRKGTWHRTAPISESVRELLVREEYVSRFGLAILDEFTVKSLQPFSPILEVGSGCGYWAYELRKAGVDIIATDPGKKSYGWAAKTFIEIEPLNGVQAIIKYPDRNLLTVWPESGHWPVKFLLTFVRVSTAPYLIYVGEQFGAATANVQFGNILDKHFEEVGSILIPHFFSIHDRLDIWKRRKIKS